MLLIVIPKILLAVCLWIEGIVFICFAENDQSMVIDMLGLVFVLEVDKIIFAACSTEREIEAIENLPAIEPRDLWAAFKARFNLHKVAPMPTPSSPSALSRARQSVAKGLSTTAARASAKEYMLYHQIQEFVFSYGIEKIVAVGLLCGVVVSAQTYICGWDDGRTPEGA